MVRSLINRIVIVCLVVAAACGLQFSSRTLEGTETQDQLTDKQLAIQRWFAELTFLEPDIDNWDKWGKSVEDLDCDGNTCIRYEVAGLAYAASILGLKTPAYQEVAEGIMYNAIQRMTKQRVWQYIELFDDFKSQPSYPDPVAYKNIMYSGHMAQMIALFEAVFHNYTFSEQGWDFVWTDPETSAVSVIHYNTSLLMEKVYRESLAYGIGGVPCEPDSIFIICNNYPQNAWLLHDALHGSNFSAQSVSSWHQTVRLHGFNRLDALSEHLENVFKLDYLIKPLGIWEPIGNVGSDMWALGWMKTWWPAEDIGTSLQPTFTAILNSSRWMQGNSSVEQLSSYAYLHPQDRTQKLFPFSDAITTSFYPLVEKQFLSHQDSIAVGKYSDVLRYFESEYSQALDVDGDGIVDLFQYNTDLCADQSVSLCSTGDYSIWMTSNLLIGMLHPEDDLNYLRRIFHPIMEQVNQVEDLAFVSGVDYPHVMVAFAKCKPVPTADASNPSMLTRNLTVVFKPGDHAPTESQLFHATLRHIPRGALSRLDLLLDGSSYKIYDVNPDTTDGFVKLEVRLSGWTAGGVAGSQSKVLTLLY